MQRAKCRHKPRLALAIGAIPATEFYTFQSLPSRYRHSEEISACEVCGDSLTRAGIPQGHMVAILNGGAVKAGDLAAVKVHDEPESQLVRFVFFGPAGCLRLQAADRDEYPDLIYQPGQFDIVGPIVHAEPRTVRLTALPED